MGPLICTHVYKYAYAWCVRVGANSYVRMLLRVVCVYVHTRIFVRARVCIYIWQACRGVLIARGMHKCVYSWCVRLGAHLYIGACKGTLVCLCVHTHCDGVRVAVYLYSRVTIMRL